MIYDKLKIFPLSMDEISFTFINGDRDQKRIVRDVFETIFGYHLRNQISTRWLRTSGRLTIMFGAQRSAAFIGTDGLDSMAERNEASIRFKDSHINEDHYRVIVHEFFHVLGCKHQHDIPSLLNGDPNRFAVSHPNNDLSVLRYRQDGEERNYYASQDDLDFLHNYDDYRQLGDSYKQGLSPSRIANIENQCICALSTH